MRLKKMVPRVFITFCCLAISLLQYSSVFATVLDDAMESNSYVDLAKIYLWTQAVGHCADQDVVYNGKAGEAANLYKTGGMRPTLLRWAELRLSYGQSSMYNSYLESKSANTGASIGGVSDGKVWCSEFFNTEKGIYLFDELFGAIKSSGFEIGIDEFKQTAICGVEGSEPLFKIKIENSGTWPTGWAKPDNEDGYLSASDCNVNYGKILGLLRSDNVVDSGGDFFVTFTINENFNVYEWLKGYVGDLSSLSAAIKLKMNLIIEYFVFQLPTLNICGATKINGDIYRDAINNGYAHFYKIYNPIDGETQYYQLENNYDKEVYASIYISEQTDNKKITCDQLGKTLGDDFSGTNARATQVNACYEQHSVNVEKFEKIRIYLNQILHEAKFLATMAEAVIEYRPTTPWPDSAQIIKDFATDGDISGTVLDSLISETEQFQDAVDEYVKMRWEIGLDDRAKADDEYREKIQWYKSYVESFEKEKVNEVISKIDPVLENPISLSDAIHYVYGFLAGVEDEVPGFYSYDEGGEFTCVVLDSDNNLIDDINLILDSEIDVTEYVPPSVDDWDDGDNNNGDPDPCYAGSGSLGWILCPVITAAGGIGEFMWNNIEDILQMPVNELFGKDNSSVEDAWKLIRDIANIVFIILILFVIFSQLTGVGIDNYGIKKILPKLIVVAILVNLSYVLCRIAVDLSNIVGSGINNMLTGFSSNIAPSDGASVGWQIGSWLTTAAGVGAAVTIWALLAEGGIAQVGAVIGLAALGIIISIVVAVATLYIILGVRTAGVILCIVLSPVAIVCHALPNTERIYKKWFDLFKALLIVYPICGAMVGAGQFAGAILASTQNGTMKLMAMIVQVVPFFFVPSLLKSSLSLMGNVGAKLSSMGKTFGRKGSGFAKGVVKGTDAYKDFSQRNLARKAARIQKRYQDKAHGDMDNLNAKQKNRLRRAQDIVIANKTREYENERRSNPDYYKSAMAAAEADVVDKETAQRLALMKSGGGQVMLEDEDGKKKPAAYTLANLETRMEQLHKKASGEALSKDDEVELAALARGLSSMSGGGSVLSRVVRGIDTSGRIATEPNLNFMNAFSRIYSQDSAVQKKLNEKDAGASAYTERFLGGGTADSPSFKDFSTDETGALRDNYKDSLNKRIKSYAAGLNQSGAALTEYLGTLGKQDCQRIMDDDALLKSLDVDTRRKFEKYADETWSVKSKTPQTVKLASAGENRLDIPRDTTGGTGATGGATGGASRDNGLDLHGDDGR